MSGRARLALLGVVVGLPLAVGTAYVIQDQPESEAEALASGPPVITLERSLPEVFAADAGQGPGESLHVRWSAPGSTRCVISSDLDAAGDYIFEFDAAPAGIQKIGPVVVAAGYQGFVKARCRTGPGLANVAETSLPVAAVAVPTVVETRVFDTSCLFRHSLPDDPLVFPVVPGASHLHDFFANKSTDAFSTGASLLAAGREELAETGQAGCADTDDHAAYWNPVLYKNGTQVTPAQDQFGFHNHVYYRGDNQGVFKDMVQPFPIGFGMVAKHKDGTPWTCGDSLGQSPIPIRCPNQKPVTGVIALPNCWNGVDLFLPSNAHVTGPQGGPCPPAFPVRLPALTVISNYGPIYNDPAEPDATWTLSDNADGSQQPISNYHVDFFNAWEPSRMDHLIHLCLNQSGNGDLCHLDGER